MTWIFVAMIDSFADGRIVAEELADCHRAACASAMGAGQVMSRDRCGVNTSTLAAPRPQAMISGAAGSADPK
jgi:hypothetical protein